MKTRKTHVTSKQKQRRFDNFLSCLEQANEADGQPAVNQTLHRSSVALEAQVLSAVNNGYSSSDDCDATWGDDEGDDSSSDEKYSADNREQPMEEEAPFQSPIEHHLPSLWDEDGSLALSETKGEPEDEIMCDSSSNSSNSDPLETSEDEASLLPLEDDWTVAQMDSYLARENEVDGATELA